MNSRIASGLRFQPASLVPAICKSASGPFFAAVFNFEQIPPSFSVHGTGLDQAAGKAAEPIAGGTVKTQADYRQLAEDCVRLAQTAKETHRAMLLNMAHTWLQLADRLADDHQWMVGAHDAHGDKHP